MPLYNKQEGKFEFFSTRSNIYNLFLHILNEEQTNYELSSNFKEINGVRRTTQKVYFIKPIDISPYLLNTLILL